MSRRGDALVQAIYRAPADARLTLRLCATADLVDLPLLDHLIVGDANRYYSFREAGLIERSPAWS